MAVRVHLKLAVSDRRAAVGIGRFASSAWPLGGAARRAKSLGFIPRQLRQAVAWQATTIAAIALIIGLPAGVAAGRWAWRYLAPQLGVLPEPAIPLTAIFIAIPAALVLANLIAAAPGQAAARTQPATILRTE